MERKQLLELLYNARSDNYPNLSAFKTQQKLLERRKKVLAMLTTQKEGTNRWKKLSIEREFIRMKLILCFKESPPSIEIILDRARLELLDSCYSEETAEEKKATKKESSLILLKYVMLSRSDETLRVLVDGL